MLCCVQKYSYGFALNTMNHLPVVSMRPGMEPWKGDNFFNGLERYFLFVFEMFFTICKAFRRHSKKDPRKAFEKFILKNLPPNLPAGDLQ